MKLLCSCNALRFAKAFRKYNKIGSSKNTSHRARSSQPSVNKYLLQYFENYESFDWPIWMDQGILEYTVVLHLSLLDTFSCLFRHSTIALCLMRKLNQESFFNVKIWVTILVFYSGSKQSSHHLLMKKLHFNFTCSYISTVGPKFCLALQNSKSFRTEMKLSI